MKNETLPVFIERLKNEGLENYSFSEMATNDIISSCFKEIAFDWEKHYHQLYINIIEILMRNEKEYNKRVLSAFSHHYSSKFFLREIGENCQEYSDFKENEAYKKGYNKAVSELKVYFDNQEELVKISIQKAFTLRCD